MLQILGLPIRIRWDKFVPGTSFFVPCLDTKPVIAFVAKEAWRQGYEIIYKRTVAGGKYGLRVWRVK